MRFNKMHIDDFLLHVLNDKDFRRQAYQLFLQDNCAIDTCYVYGCISKNILFQLLKKAKRDRCVRAMLPAFIPYADEASLTDENFRCFFSFHGKFRNTCLSILGHLHLPTYQLQILNRYPLSYEAFCQLFDRMCQSDCFCTEDVLQLLRENCDVRVSAIAECIRFAQEAYGKSEKIEAATQWVESFVFRKRQNRKQ